MTRRPPGATRTDTLLPSTTLYRSRLVGRAFGIGPSALTEAMGMLNHHFAAAACSAQSDSLPLTAANLCNRAAARAIPGPGRGQGLPWAARPFRARVPRYG